MSLEASNFVGSGFFTDATDDSTHRESSVEEPTTLHTADTNTATESNPIDYGEDEVEFLNLSMDKLQVRNFPSSDVMLAFYDDSLNSGHFHLNDWQIEENKRLSTVQCSSIDPFKFYLCAVNGSGKDNFLIAPLSVWYILCHKKARVVITSSSGTQLTAQTETYIKNLCTIINEFEKQVNGIDEVFKINQRYIRCNLSGSEIRMFATDEKGKAEGYHPIIPGARMMIIVNEAKTVKDEIFEALTRCTGYDLWIEVSSPGEANGHFYKRYTAAADTNKRLVTFFDCSHKGLAELEDLKLEYGEHSALFGSMVYGRFSSIGGQSVIKKETIDKWLACAIEEQYQNWPDRVGIDIAAGGDENAMVCCKGNRLRKKHFFREVDTTITADVMNRILLEWGISKTSDYIFADDGGIGHAVIDMLQRMGWNIKRIRNQGVARNKREYGNLGAEMWYRVNRIIEEGVFDLASIRDDKLINQLSTRYYKQEQTSGRIMLESKPDAKAHGRPSPDRADAFVLSFFGLTIEDFLGEGGSKVNSIRKTITIEEVVKMRQKAISSEGIDAAWYEQLYPQLFNKQPDEPFQREAALWNSEPKAKRVRGSLMAALENN